MSTASLTARYRPQTFAQVAGQDTLKTILSRASLESKVAPAYLFSGTRGVGKTTLARVFAKALNCRTAPTAEPCNACDQCRAVTQGNSVDVVEIDGASNRGIDDVRRLKEVVGYAPMEGRYKIFIIDEAHMLSREAFNALLKTLEEPPARVTFIMATTEPHKFPATIISRCQHHVFKRLPENSLVAHLTYVLQQEGIDFDDSAVRLIARRGAGSVRDSMSLLGQVLALGAGRLTEDSTRNVLGLAGQEAFSRMLAAFKAGDSLTLTRTLREILDQGLDMGFFLRELSSLWRNMFILRQSGEQALAVVELPEAEARTLLEAAQGFSLAHIHASWQMTLEGQRRVLTSLEPALALELLILNLAMLPQLISLEQLTALGRRSGSSGNAPAGGNTPSAGGKSTPPVPRGIPCASGNTTPASGTFSSETAPHTAPTAVHAEEKTPEPASAPITDAALCAKAAPAIVPPAPEPALVTAPAVVETVAPEATPVNLPPAAELATASPAPAMDPPASFPRPSWEDVVQWCVEHKPPPWFAPLTSRLTAKWQGETLALQPKDTHTAQLMQDEQTRVIFMQALRALCGAEPTVTILAPTVTIKSRDDLKEEIFNHPSVHLMEQAFDARVSDYGQIR